MMRPKAKFKGTVGRLQASAMATLKAGRNPDGRGIYFWMGQRKENVHTNVIWLRETIASSGPPAFVGLILLVALVAGLSPRVT